MTMTDRRHVDRRTVERTTEEWVAMLPTPEPVRTSGLKLTCLGLLLVHTFLALAFAIGAPLRFTSSSFDTAKQAMTLHQWAFVFAVTAISLLTTWHHRRALIVQLFAGMFLYLFWASCFAWSIHSAPSAGLTGPILWGFCALAQLACASALIPPRARR